MIAVLRDVQVPFGVPTGEAVEEPVGTRRKAGGGRAKTDGFGLAGGSDLPDADFTSGGELVQCDETGHDEEQPRENEGQGYVEAKPAPIQDRSVTGLGRMVFCGQVSPRSRLGAGCATPRRWR